MTFDRRYIIKFRFSPNSSLIICKNSVFFFLSGSSAKFPGLGHQVQVRKRKGGRRIPCPNFLFISVPMSPVIEWGILAFFFWKEVFSFIYNRFFEFSFLESEPRDAIRRICLHGHFNFLFLSIWKISRSLCFRKRKDLRSFCVFCVYLHTYIGEARE